MRVSAIACKRTCLHALGGKAFAFASCQAIPRSSLLLATTIRRPLTDALTKLRQRALMRRPCAWGSLTLSGAVIPARPHFRWGSRQLPCCLVIRRLKGLTQCLHGLPKSALDAASSPMLTLDRFAGDNGKRSERPGVWELMKGSWALNQRAPLFMEILGWTWLLPLRRQGGQGQFS